jgi:ribosomal protein RSM22 (predicted rRNA methylase)
MLEPNPALRELARKLGSGDTEFLSGKLDADKPQADLMVASYVLAELPENKAARVAVDLWNSARRALALIEPGTPQGFARIRAARAALIEAGAHVAAPCTHNNACPLQGDDWCHFSQRLARSRDHMLLKEATVPFEDERYSYVVVTREARAPGARILAPSLDGKPGLTFKLCDETGLRTHFVAARDKDEHRRVKKRGWGDLF